ncbi:MAG: pyridoxamine 5'-phosphate oxidase family protein [Candidatus Omnitrophica bacterium]|nr:pyridoxamine 5'-phosphate oxidase family protein [Candidatus Omnitrophota bacterium]
MLTKVRTLLEKREFISVATSDKQGKPNAAPKFILKLDGNFIYLVDYTMGRTYANLKANPRISLSFMDTESLAGYQVNGGAGLIESGPEYEAICAEVLTREVGLSARRIIEGVTREKKHHNFEVAIRDTVVIIKVEIKEVIEIGPSGTVARHQV